MFLFERKGSVRISLDEADDLDTRLERVVDAAFNAGAEDFEHDEPSEGTVEVEVFPPCRWRVFLSRLQCAQCIVVF
jgi:transcriptional/translational regulatory protein YebC/TACO1